MVEWIKIALIVFWLMVGAVNFASAEWNWSDVQPQPFTSTDNYIIAVGTKDKPEVVQASDVVKALREAKEVRLRHAKIEGSIEFHDNVEQVVYFINTTFLGESDFGFATFSGEADFSSATFSGGVSFYRAKFYREVDFGSAKFHREVSLFRVLFFEGAFFNRAKFYRKASFWQVVFKGKAHFGGAQFSEWAGFSDVEFFGESIFSGARFMGVSDFEDCLYPEDAKINFNGVTGFSQMLIEWENNEENRKGLKGHLEYDETFYIALINNYQDVGKFPQADDAYYTYRVEKRKKHHNHLHGLAELVFLEIPFGYGVKPLKLLRSFLILWVLFSWYYACFLRHTDAPWWRAWNPFRHKFLCFAWAIIHSLNTLTPGIDLYSLKDPFLKKSPYVFNAESQWVIWGERMQQILGWYLLVLFLILFGKIWIR